MVRVRVSTRFFDDFDRFRSQVPFAIALAVTGVAKKARDRLKTTLPDFFTVRNAYTAKRVGMVAAKKGNPVAVVGSGADYMRLQAIGGTRAPGTKPGTAIPLHARLNPRKLLNKRSEWPKALVKAGKAYKAAGTIRATDKYGGGTDEGDVLYLLGRDDRIQLQPRWPFQQLVSETVGANWDSECKKAMRAAIKTARR